MFEVSGAGRSGERGRRELLLDEESFGGYVALGRGDSSVGVSVSRELGVSGFGLKAPCGTAFGGSAGRDLSTSIEDCSFSRSFDCAAALDFFRRLAINDSWQFMQKMPCEVLAYRRFSILRLQFLQRKHVAQNAWSPVRIARSSILFPHALQLYVQLLQMREPSPSSRRFASESSRVPQVLHLKQFKCHRLPAVIRSACKIVSGKSSNSLIHLNRKAQEMGLYDADGGSGCWERLNLLTKLKGLSFFEDLNNVHAQLA